MQSILLIIHVLMALALIGLILIQHGKGADAGAAFGSGASSTVFGSGGSGSFLTKATGVLALVFFSNSFFLSYLSTTGTEPESLMEKTLMQDEVPEQAVKETDSAMAEGDDLPKAVEGVSDQVTDQAGDQINDLANDLVVPAPDENSGSDAPDLPSAPKQ